MGAALSEDMVEMEVAVHDRDSFQEFGWGGRWLCSPYIWDDITWKGIVILVKNQIQVTVTQNKVVDTRKNEFYCDVY